MTCGHDGCKCRIEQAGDFCSDHCREHAGDAGHGAHACECGHPECQASATGGGEKRTEQDLQAAFE